MKLLKIIFLVETKFEKLRELRLEQETKFVSASRIRSSISVHLRSISTKHKNRIKSRMNAGLIGGGNNFHNIAENRAAGALLEFVRFHTQINRTLEIISLFNTKIKQIQDNWRIILKFDSLRVNKIAILWDNKVENLIKANCKGRKQQAFARRIKLIPESSKFKVLSQYYREAKLKFLQTLHRYFGQLRQYETNNQSPVQSIPQDPTTDTFYITSLPTTHASSVDIFFKRNSILQPSVKKRFSIGCDKKVPAIPNAPRFRYLPTEEQLHNLIIQTAEKKLVPY